MQGASNCRVKSRWRIRGFDVRCWHVRDMPAASWHVCSPRKTGSRRRPAPLPSLTQLGHPHSFAEPCRRLKQQHQAAQSRRSEAPSRNGHGCSQHSLADVPFLHSRHSQRRLCFCNGMLALRSIGVFNWICLRLASVRAERLPQLPAMCSPIRKSSASRVSFLEVGAWGR